MKRSTFTGATAFLIVAVANGQLYGLSNGFGTATGNMVYQINPANGDLSGMIAVTVAGLTITRSQAMANDPTSNTLYAVLQDNANVRHLATVNPITGVGVDMGALNHSFSGLAFKTDGTLIGVTGDGDATDPESLYTINKANAGTTFMFHLGNGLDGETIAMHPNGLMYHSSGNGTALFESVDLNTQVVTPIGSATSEAFAMGYLPTTTQMLLSDISSNLYSVNIGNGSRTLIGAMSDQLGSFDNRGLAYVPVPEPASVTVLVLGAGVLLRRRRNRA